MAEATREDEPAWDGKRFGQDQTSARLYVHIARDAPIAAILRRGPGRHTALLKWDLNTDEITLGQWVDARIYERRCDLSTDGKYLLYFAANHRAPLFSWTAISILPWFRACVLWQKGDCWGGGGIFGENRTVLLNHRVQPYYENIQEFQIHSGHLPRPWKSVAPFGDRPGWGEDEPINGARLARQGWCIAETPESVKHSFDGAYRWIFQGQFVKTKPGPDGWVLSLVDDAGAETNGRWHLTECLITTTESQKTRSFGLVDWADWHNGTLLFARNGCLWRIDDLASGQPKLVSDRNAMKYQHIIAPYEGAGRAGVYGWHPDD